MDEESKPDSAEVPLNSSDDDKEASKNNGSNESPEIEPFQAIPIPSTSTGPNISKPSTMLPIQKVCETKEEQDEIWKGTYTNSQISSIAASQVKQPTEEEQRERCDNYTFAPVEKIKNNKLFQKFIESEMNKKNDEDIHDHSFPTNEPTLANENQKKKSQKEYTSPRSAQDDPLNFQTFEIDLEKHKPIEQQNAIPSSKVSYHGSEKHSPVEPEKIKKETPKKKSSPKEQTSAHEEQELKATSEHIDNIPNEKEDSQNYHKKQMRFEYSDPKIKKENYSYDKDESDSNEKSKKLQLELDVSN